MKSKLLAAVLAAGASFAPMSLGCYGSAEYVAYDDPPPPREEVVVARPGFVFIHGRWQRESGRWRWQSGSYVRERPGFTFEEGRWDHHGNRRVWIEGRWRSRG